MRSGSRSTTHGWTQIALILLLLLLVGINLYRGVTVKKIGIPGIIEVEFGAPGKVARKPEVLSFAAEPSRITRGGSSTLQWRTSGAAEVKLDGTRVEGSGSEQVRPRNTTTYELIASNEEGVRESRRIIVTVQAPVPAPRILSFEAKPSRIATDESSTLRWRTADAAEVKLDGTRVEGSGSEQVRPKSTTTYELIAGNEEGVRESRRIIVKVQAPVPAPRILSFEAKPSRIARGESSALRWRTADAAEVKLDGTRVEGSGSEQVRPKSTTTYELVAGNEEGLRVRRTVKLEVRSSMTINLDIRPQKRIEGEPITIRVQVRSDAGKAVDGAGVELHAKGGIFERSAKSLVSGWTDTDGLFFATWTAETGRAGQYEATAVVSKEGFVKGTDSKTFNVEKRRELTPPTGLRLETK